MSRQLPVLAAVAGATLVMALTGTSRALAGAGSATATPAAAAATVLSLPPPSGPHRIGTVALHLVDPSRTDPWLPTHPARELMVQLWYPAAHADRYPYATYLPALAARHFAANATQRLGVPVSATDFTGLHTGARLGAAVARPPRPGWPVVLFSPGDGLDRNSCTALAQDLASRGYVVVGIDHTHDSSEVQFPGERLEVRTIPAGSDDPETQVRAADTRFVLDQLVRLDGGSDPDADGQPVPAGMRGALNLAEVGMFGHSHGGTTTAEVMLQDHRVRAGADVDGSVSDRVAAAGLDQPFLNLNSEAGGPGRAKFERNLPALWPRLAGWHLWLRLHGSAHLDFTDLALFAAELHAPPSATAGTIGTIDARRAHAVTSAYLVAFLDQELRHRHRPLLDRPSPCYPEMLFETR